MSHYLKKYTGGAWETIATNWEDLGLYWESIGNQAEYLIRAAVNKNYWLQPQNSAQSWEWTDGESGNDIVVFCPETANQTDLEIGSFYYLFAEQDLISPICAFYLVDLITEYSPAADSPYIYKLIGKSWRGILQEPGIVVDLNLSKASFKTVCVKLLEQIVDGHPAFSTDDNLIVDDDFVFPAYRARTYAYEVIQDLESYGYKIWFDSRLRLNAVKAELESRNYTVGSVISPREFTVLNASKLAINDRFEHNQIICKIVSVVGNSVTIDKSLNLTIGAMLQVTSSYIVDLDWDRKISGTSLSLLRNDNPASRFWIQAKNVVSTFAKTDTFTASGKIAESVYELAQKPASANRFFTAFDKKAELNDSFNFAPIGDIADQIQQGRLVINSIPTGLFSTHKRDYKNTLESRVGLSVGLSMAINRASGKIALLGLKAAPSDLPSAWQAGFVVDGDQLKIINQELEIATSFGLLVPTVERSVTSITPAGGGSVINIDNNDLIYKVGETLTVQLNGETRNFGKVLSATGSSVTIDRAVSFLAGMTLLQQADYLLKISYSAGYIQWFAKRGIDAGFTLLRQELASLPTNTFLQLYANQLHSCSLDFIDVSENAGLSCERISPFGEIRAMDVGFAETASYLQSEVQIFEEDGVYKLKFEALTNDKIYIPQLIISNSELVLQSVAGLAVGSRLLINDLAVRILSINAPAKSIVINIPVPGLAVSSPVYFTDTIPGLGETLNIKYKPVEDISIGLCGTSCFIPQNKATKLITIDTQQSVTYDTFRRLATNEVDKFCTPEVSGSFEMIIESYKPQESGWTGILSDIPHAGQRIRLKTRGSNNTLYEDLESTINEVKLIATGHSNAFKCLVSFGSDRYKFERYLTNLKRAAIGQVKLLRDDFPVEDLICAIEDSMSFDDQARSPINVSKKPFRSGTYRGAWISGML